MKIRLLIITLLLLSTFNVLQAQEKKLLLHDVYIRTTVNDIEFGNRKIKLVVDKVKGHLKSMQLQPNASFVQAATMLSSNVQINGKVLLQHNMPLRMKHTTSVNKASSVSMHVEQTLTGSNNTITTTFILYPGKVLVERVIAISTRSDTAQQLGSFNFTLPHFVIGNSSDCVVNVPGPFWPGTFTPADMPYDSLRSKITRYHSAPDGGFGIFSITNKKAQTTITAFIKTTGDAGYHTIANGSTGIVNLEQNNNRAVYLKPGESVTSDTQHVEITKTFDEAMDAYRAITMRNMPVEKVTPDWTKEAVILEILPRYFKGGFKEITSKLLFYKEIGINTIYLMPHWKGGYGPVDLYTVEESLGTKEDLQKLVQTAHSLGLRVLFDMVIHGFNKRSPVIKEHPEFFYRSEKDSLVIHPNWGSVMTDFMNPSYQQYMKDYVLYEQKTFGMDGYRVDAASYKGPNWNKKVSYPAYKSGTASPLLMKIMLDALREKDSSATLLSEVFGPVFYTISNFAHDNQTEAMSYLIKETEAGRYRLGQYQKHLQYVYGSLPKGIVRVFYTRNHDTSWFYEFFGYSPLFFSFEAIHSFFGVPEIFAGDLKYKFNPDDDPATYVFYKKLFATRRNYPEFIHGEKRFDVVACNDADVFTAMAEDEKYRSVFITSAAPQAKEITITIDDRFLKGTPVAMDVINQTAVPVVKKAGGLVVMLEPHQVVVVRL